MPASGVYDRHSVCSRYVYYRPAGAGEFLCHAGYFSFMCTDFFIRRQYDHAISKGYFSEPMSYMYFFTKPANLIEKLAIFTWIFIEPEYQLYATFIKNSGRRWQEYGRMSKLNVVVMKIGFLCF